MVPHRLMPGKNEFHSDKDFQMTSRPMIGLTADFKAGTHNQPAFSMLPPDTTMRSLLPEDSGHSSTDRR